MYKAFFFFEKCAPCIRQCRKIL